MSRALKTKNCMAYARKATIEGAQTNLSIEAVLREIIKSLPDASERKTLSLFNDQFTQLTDYDNPQNGGIAICIDCYSPQNAASIIKTEANTPTSPKTSMLAKKGHSLVKYEAWAYIRGNELLIAGDIVKDYIFDKLVDELAVKAKVISSDLKISTAPITVQDKIKQVQKYGVRQIELDISEYAHELEEATDEGKSALEKPFAVIRDLLSCRDAESILAKSHVSYKLVVDVTKIKKAQLSKDADGSTSDPVERWAKHAAEGVLEDYINDYTIRLRGQGGNIKKSELTVSRTIKVHTLGKSFDTKDMWFQLVRLFNELNQDGVL